jgi:hypothetical protein
MNTDSQAFGDLKPVAPGRPKMVFIGVTDRCNTRCRHCPHYHYTFGTDMSEAVMRKAIDALAEGLELIAPQGVGEPLIAKPFYMVLEACERSGVPVGFATNGILLRDEALVRRLVRAPVQIGVSIDGARPETYHFVRPLQDWDQLLEALALVQRCRKEAGPECRGSLSFVCVAMKDTFGDLPDLVRMAHRYGVPSIRVQALFGNNDLDALRGQSPFEAPDVVAPASLEGMAVARELGIKLDLPPSFQSMACDRALAGDAPWLDHLTPGARLILDELLAQRATGPNTAQAGPKTGISPCRWPWDWTHIASSGVVHGCCMGGPTLRDLNTEDWEAIWNGPRYQSFRRLVHSWNPPATCRVCILIERINAGDSTRYARYFEQFQVESVDLADARVEFGEGFEQIDDDGGKQAWRLHGLSGGLTLPTRPGARFLCLMIAAAAYGNLTPGTCTISGGPPEPFDLSCDHPFFPIDHVSADRLEVRFEMEGLGAGELVIRAASLLLAGAGFEPRTLVPTFGFPHQ